MDEIRSRKVATNGIELNVLEQGEGLPVLFCHGFPATARSWRHQMAAVAAAGFRAIAPDMRGYGGSDAPEDRHSYTSQHCTGDLVGLLDAFGLETAFLVGHDFGAAVVWNAAMIRPDRFTAVAGLSVTFRPPGGTSFLQKLAEAGRDDFYMFHQMSPDAEREWSDAAMSVPGSMYWCSGDAPEDKRWDPFDPARRLVRPAPDDKPAWMTDGLVDAVAADFDRNGFRGPLSYYHSIQPYHDLGGAFVGMRVHQPALFLTGQSDGLLKVSPVDEDQLREGAPNLQRCVILPGIGHWPQLEAPDAVNAELTRFLGEMAARR